MSKFPILLIAIALSGCAAFTPPKEKPVIEDKVKQIGLLTVTPERRAIIVNDPVQASKFCAEPSPDVAEGISSSLKALVEASAKDSSGKSIEASGQIAKSFATSINNLFTRSQGVQLFRDGSYALCQAYQNGAVDSTTFQLLFADLLKKSFTLSLHELPTIEIKKAEEFAKKTQQARSEAELANTAAKAAAESAKAAEIAALESEQKATESAESAKKASKPSNESKP